MELKPMSENSGSYGQADSANPEPGTSFFVVHASVSGVLAQRILSVSECQACNIAPRTMTATRGQRFDKKKFHGVANLVKKNQWEKQSKNPASSSRIKSIQMIRPTVRLPTLCDYPLHR
jgi:hypothetical protein